ncbi:hypothetical protein SDC9_210700 [bioreactor metagenome]|uniref:Uncharacterized protein n=1 Tax=bioreactor metagenome TaxID=1076179 RepID=A0A645JHX4_9ZZZZ
MDFLHLAGAIRDDPVTADQACSRVAGVADGDVIGEDVVVFFHAGLGRNELSDGFHFDSIRLGGAHAKHSPLVGCGRREGGADRVVQVCSNKSAK